MTETEKLIERLEKATGPDRELDVDMMVALGGARRVDDFTFYGPNGAVWSFGEHEDESPAWNGPLPYVTASLDAALALVERVRPGWAVEITSWPREGGWSAQLDPHNIGDDEYPATEGPTPAIALCLALLRTLETSHD